MDRGRKTPDETRNLGGERPGGVAQNEHAVAHCASSASPMSG